MLGLAGDAGAPSGSAGALESPKTFFDIDRIRLGRAGDAGVPSGSADAPASPKTFFDIERSRLGRAGGPGEDVSLADSSATTTFDIDLNGGSDNAALESTRERAERAQRTGPRDRQGEGLKSSFIQRWR